MSTLFDPGPAAHPEHISPDRRRTIRRKALLAIGIHPTTGARLAGNGETCGSCAHILEHHHNKRTYWKCDKTFVTCGAATDVRLGWPACSLWENAS